MDMTKYYAKENELPLDSIPTDGGFAGIFRKIGCVGDSLSSGEFESLDENGNRGYHDMYEYSWGQYLGRLIGAEVVNLSRGGMTAFYYDKYFDREMDIWNKDKVCECYIFALGVNDVVNNPNFPMGTVDDICMDDPEKCSPDTFAGCYGKVLARYRQMQPKARYFLMTMFKEAGERARINPRVEEHAALLHDIAARFPFMYVIDYCKYGPVIDDEFRRNFFMGGHLNAAGYLLSSRMTAAYMDYIIRHNPEDFAQVGFIGKDYHNVSVKW